MNSTAEYLVVEFKAAKPMRQCFPRDLEMFAAPFENDVNCTVFVCSTPEFPNLITKTEVIRVMLIVNENHGDINIPPSIMENYTFFHTGKHSVLNILGGGAILKMK